MPAGPRKDIIREEQVGYCHCHNRCVRRSFFCGLDPLTGNDYELNLWLSPIALAPASASKSADAIAQRSA